MNERIETPRPPLGPLFRGLALRVALLAVAQIATARAYYGVTNMYLKLQFGVLEDGTPRLFPMTAAHLVAFDALVVALAVARSTSASTRVKAGLALPVLATVVAGWLNSDPPVGRAFIAALSLAALVIFGVFPLASVSSSSDADAS